jgi:hypothetical protein
MGRVVSQVFIIATFKTGQQAVHSRLPVITKQRSLVVGLRVPTIAVWIEGRRVGPCEERRGVDDFVEMEHRITSEEIEKIVDAPNLDVIQDQQSARCEVRVEEVVLKVGERICVRAINEHQLQPLGEPVYGQRALRWALDESDCLTSE